MSSSRDNRSSSHIYGGISVDVVEESLERVSKVLASVPGGVYKAVGSALSRSAQAGKTAVKKAIAQEYFISSGTFLRYTQTINHFDKGSDLSIVFGYRGYTIPLIQFSTRPGPNGVFAHVERKSSGDLIEHAFIAQMGGHTGIFERIGPDRFPVRELYGPSTPQMMYSNEAVLDQAEQKICETYETRIEHEIDRILNGWGM